MKSLNYLVVVPRVVSRAGDWYQPPLGIAYIMAVLKEAGFRVFGLNLNDSDEYYADRLSNTIESKSIDVVLTGGVTGQYSAIYDIVSASKKINNSIVNIVGGGIVTSLPYEAMEALEYVDYGVIGEGEIVVCQLANALQNKTDIEEVPSIIYQVDTIHKLTTEIPKTIAIFNKNESSWKQKYRRTTIQVPVVDITQLPYPDFEGIGFSQLIKTVPNVLGMSEIGTLPIITSRGCPFKCTFCYQPDGQAYRMRDLDEVFEEIDYLVETYDLKYLAVIDELFGAKKGRVEEFCKRIKPYGIRWTATFRIPQLTPTVVKLLKESNFHTASLGIESMDDSILKSMQKKITKKHTEDGLSLLYEAGIGIQGVLIFGDPEETKETAQNTLDWWMENIQYDLQLSAIITYPGTPIYDKAIAKGIIKDPVQFIKDGCPLIKLSNMPDRDHLWMFQQILALPRERYSVPKKYGMISLDYKNGTITTKGECVHCGERNIWKDVRAFMLEAMTCLNCGRRHIAHIPDEFISRVVFNYNKIVSFYGKSAFWGINSYFYSFIKKAFSQIDDFYLVDRGESRIGVPIEGCTGCIIENPDIIDLENVRCVIVAVPNYFSTIKSSVLEVHPKVEAVFSITDLLNENFEVNESPSIRNRTFGFVSPDLESSVCGQK